MRAGRTYPIQAVARRTGLNVELLRAWERRYRAVTPAREGSGRRLYSDADVARLKLLRQVVARGLKIKDAAARSNAELEEYLRTDAADVVERPATVGDAAGIVAQCKAAVEASDVEALEAAMERAPLELTMPSVLDDVLAPLVQWIGTAWSAGQLRIYQEHLATAALRTFIANRLHALPGDAATIVVATPIGEPHELGALLSAVSAAGAGWHVTYLGPSLPAAEIAAAAKRFEARAVALSIVAPARRAVVDEELRLLRRLLGPELLLVVGGSGTARHMSTLIEIEADVVDRAGRLGVTLAALL